MHVYTNSHNHHIHQISPSIQFNKFTKPTVHIFIKHIYTDSHNHIRLDSSTSTMHVCSKIIYMHVVPLDFRDNFTVNESTNIINPHIYVLQKLCINLHFTYFKSARMTMNAWTQSKDLTMQE